MSENTTLCKRSYLLGYIDGQKNEWISVKESQPLFDIYVLLSKIGENTVPGWIGTNGKYYTTFPGSDDVMSFNATHWMPLRSPPEDK